MAINREILLFNHSITWVIWCLKGGKENDKNDKWKKCLSQLKRDKKREGWSEKDEGKIGCDIVEKRGEEESDSDVEERARGERRNRRNDKGAKGDRI